MGFILSVFGANVVIVLGVFVYIYMIFVTYKFLFDERYVNWKKYGFDKAYESWKDEEFNFIFGHLPTILFWPVSIVCYIIWIVLSNFIPYTCKFFDKITPSIKIVKGDKE